MKINYQVLTKDGIAEFPTPKRRQAFVDLGFFYGELERAAKVAGVADWISNIHWDWLPRLLGCERCTFFDSPGARNEVHAQLWASDFMDVRYGSKSRREKGDPLEQKEVDVLLTCEALYQGFQRNMETAIIVTQDRDFRPLCETLTRIGIRTVVIGGSKTSEELRTCCDMYRQLTLMSLTDLIGYSLRIQDRDTFSFPSHVYVGSNTPSGEVLATGWQKHYEKGNGGSEEKTKYELRRYDHWCLLQPAAREFGRVVSLRDADVLRRYGKTYLNITWDD